MINLAEKVLVTTTDAQKLQAITGSRKNLHFEGTVCSDAAPWINQTVRGCLARSLVCVQVSEVYGVPRHDLAGLTRLAPVFKHELLGSFRVAGAPNNQQRTDGSAKDNVAGEPITWNPRHSHMIEELLHRCRPRAVTLMTAAEPATASVISSDSNLLLGCIAV